MLSQEIFSEEGLEEKIFIQETSLVCLDAQTKTLTRVPEILINQLVNSFR